MAPHSAAHVHLMSFSYERIAGSLKLATIKDESIMHQLFWEKLTAPFLHFWHVRSKVTRSVVFYRITIVQHVTSKPEDQRGFRHGAIHHISGKKKEEENKGLDNQPPRRFFKSPPKKQQGIRLWGIGITK